MSNPQELAFEGFHDPDLNAPSYSPEQVEALRQAEAEYGWPIDVSEPMEPVGRTETGQPVWPDGEATCAWVRERTDTVLLAFSMGKDSLSAYHRLRKHFTVVGFHLYAVPGMGFERRSLAYYREALDIPIISLPHPALYDWLSLGMHQTPPRAAAMIAARLIPYDYQFVYRMVAEAAGVEDRTPWVADGIRAADSGMRRLTHTQRGPVDQRLRKFHPVHDLYTDDVEAAITDLGVSLPVDYRLWGRTFDGVDFRFLAPLREHFPDDYAQLLRWFPFAALDFFRRGDTDAVPR